jgi:hypothetical protein
MPRRQNNPFGFIIILLPFIIAAFLKRSGRNSLNATKMEDPFTKKNDSFVKKKDFMKMEEWNTIIPDVPATMLNSPKDYLLTPEPNKADWYAFLMQ